MTDVPDRPTTRTQTRTHDEADRCEAGAGERKPMSIDELTAAVLDLPPKERAQLIAKVEDSLYPLNDIDPTVLERARCELADMKYGRVKGIPMEELLDELDRMAQ